ncbi:MAG: ABC transporter permease, partial [Cyclobacteriaceae bacterium]
MIKNLLLASIRSITRSKYYTLISVVGLGIGISCFVIISSYVAFEESFDSFHRDGASVYRVTSQKIQNGEIQNTRAQAPVILKDALQENVPEIETAIRIHPLDAKKVTLRRDLENGERIDVVENKVYHSESAFFSLFNFELISGNKENLLDEPYTVVLSESVSKKLFGDENPVGKSLRIIEDFDQVYEVTGVMRDLPSNTHFEFNLLISFESFRAQHPNWRWTAWDWDYFFTYIRASPDVTRDELLSKIQSVADRVGRPQYEERSYTMNFELQPVQDIYLTSQLEGEFKVNGEGRYLSYLYGIAIAILVLAWINFMNLAVVRVMDKASEVGVRATFGASKLHLAVQALAEMAILNLFSIVLAVLIVSLLSNPVANLLNIHLPTPQLDSLQFWLMMGLLWMGSITITSIYPLFILLRFQPKKVLKGKVEHSIRGARLWKGLVIFQYSVSILLIVLTLVVQK